MATAPRIRPTLTPRPGRLASVRVASRSASAVPLTSFGRTEAASATPFPGAAKTGDRPLLRRLGVEVDRALERRNAQELRLAAALPFFAPTHPDLAPTAERAAKELLARHATGRELFAGALKALAACGDERLYAKLLVAALGEEDGGGLATITEAGAALARPISSLRAAKIRAELQRIASSGRGNVPFHAAFSLALVDGLSARDLADRTAMLNDELRARVVLDRVLPLVVPGGADARRGLPALAPALDVLSRAERHPGRALVLLEALARCGDEDGRAAERIAAFAATSRSSEAKRPLVEGFLALADGGAFSQEKCSLAPLLELSHRPAVERDPVRIFQLATAAVPAAAPLLTTLAKTAKDAATRVRALLHLARNFGDDEAAAALRAFPATGDAAGLVAAARFDLGDREAARALADDLILAKSLPAFLFGAYVRASDEANAADASPLLTERSLAALVRGYL